MLERLTIKNFQPHEKLKIDFDPRVTSIIGSSDVGKSAVVRSLRWVVTNKPGGEAFIRVGSDRVTAIIEVDGHTLKRSRGRQNNSYHLDGEPLRSFGTDVPEPVAKLLNVTDENFQGQHDAPFWFALSAGDVSRRLNDIIDLGVIDTTLGWLNAAARDAAGAVHAAGKRSKDARDAHKGHSITRTADVALRAVERLQADVVDLGRRFHSLDVLTAEALEHEGTARNAALGAKRAGDAVLAGDAWRDAAVKRDTLQKLIADADRVSPLAVRVLPDLKPLEALAKHAETAGNVRDQLEAILEEAESADRWCDRAGSERLDVEDAFKRQMGKQCPLCQSSLI